MAIFLDLDGIERPAPTLDDQAERAAFAALVAIAALGELAQQAPSVSAALRIHKLAHDVEQAAMSTSTLVLDVADQRGQ